MKCFIRLLCVYWLLSLPQVSIIKEQKELQITPISESAVRQDRHSFPTDSTDNILYAMPIGLFLIGIGLFAWLFVAKEK